MRRPASLVAAVIACDLLASGIQLPAQARWTKLAPGLELGLASFPHRPGAVSSLNVTVVRADPRYYRLRVTDVTALSQQGTRSRPTKTITQRSGIPSLRTLSLTRPEVAVAMNGGFITSYAFPRPVGLVKVSGLTLSAASTSKPLTGVLCVRGTGAAEIAFYRSGGTQTAACVDALQSGPLLIEPGGKNGISTSEPADRVAQRAVICIESRGWPLFVHSSRTALYDLAGALARRESGGFGCMAALNLSGESDAGLMWRDKTGLRNAGSLDAALATALILQRR